MKKFMLLAIVAMFATINVFAENEVVNNDKKTVVSNDDFTCQFSLNKYSGTVTTGSGNTAEHLVYLNCPQDEDVYATVYVYIDGECVASSVYKIEAGNTRSIEKRIHVGSSYSGKNYTLKV